jgi:hypothetical protein
MDDQLGLFEEPRTGSRPRLYTSCFARNGKNVKAVAISQGIPKGWNGKRYMLLAPSWALVHEKDMEKYKTAYLAILARLDARVVVEEIGGDGVVMLCWERADKDCHRRLVAEWMREAGVDVVEI